MTKLKANMKLTAKVYTDETQLPIYDAIKGLPRLKGSVQQIVIFASDAVRPGEGAHY